MYEIITVTRTCDSGKALTFYGIKSDKIYYPDLSNNLEEIIRLCHLCNKLKIDESQILYVIDDFLNSQSGLAPELSGG